MAQNKMPSSTDNAVSITRASKTDIPTIKSMVDAAYSKYISRLGKPPGPMEDDYDELFDTHEMYVLRQTATSPSEILGSIIVSSDFKSLHINNVVVSPSAQGHGYGRLLMNYAETVAAERGIREIKLYTNVKMYENIEIYKKIGYVEYERREENGYERVFFEKIFDGRI